MSGTKHPVQQLEPSNLLEPLDLSDEHVSGVDSSSRSDHHGAPARTFRPARASAPMPRPTERGHRGPSKSALIIAGAVVCFAAGAMLTRALPTGVVKPSQTVGSATRESAPAPAAIERGQSKPTEA